MRYERGREGEAWCVVRTIRLCSGLFYLLFLLSCLLAAGYEDEGIPAVSGLPSCLFAAGACTLNVVWGWPNHLSGFPFPPCHALRNLFPSPPLLVLCPLPPLLLLPPRPNTNTNTNTGAIEDFQPRFPSGDTEWAEEINMNRQDQCFLEALLTRVAGSSS